MFFFHATLADLKEIHKRHGKHSAMGTVRWEVHVKFDVYFTSANYFISKESRDSAIGVNTIRQFHVKPGVKCGFTKHATDAGRYVTRCHAHSINSQESGHATRLFLAQAGALRRCPGRIPRAPLWPVI